MKASTLALPASVTIVATATSFQAPITAGSAAAAAAGAPGSARVADATIEITARATMRRRAAGCIACREDIWTSTPGGQGTGVSPGARAVNPAWITRSCLPTGREGILCRVAETRSHASSSIVDALAGKTMLLTGVTGFLAQVVFERLLADFPETRVVLLVRSQTGASSRDRVEYLFRKPAFDTLRERVGEDGLKAMLDD